GNQPVGLGRIDTPVYALAESTSGVVAAGSFAPNQGTYPVDVWNGTDWALFASMAGPGRAMAGLANGRVLVAGDFMLTGSSPPFYIPWTAYHGVAVVGQTAPSYYAYFSSTYHFPALAIGRMPTGTLLVAFSTPVGGALQYFDANGAPAGYLSGPPGTVEAIAASSAGTIYAAGNNPNAGHCVQWNGTQWQPLAGGVNAPVRMLTATANGDLIAGGEFTSAGGAPASRIARWNGAAWSPLGAGLDGPARACVELPDGDLVVGGAFATAGGLPAANLARWNGATWSAVAGGTNGPVRALMLAADGTIWVAGDFTAAGPLGCGYVARLVTPCPAAVASLGNGCTGSGGLNVLSATSLPWQGGVFTSRATGMPALAFVLQVNGLSQISLPLAAILPQGLPGCTLLTTPDVLDLYLPTAGVASFRLGLPAASVLIGQTIYQQAAPLELDAAFGIVALTSSNLLQLTVGGL
ncbi:MAG TPA: hypothetical protein VFT55_05720, partial [Planctomycetota bacterium]|nr:hypothetical protein [Planctomycetota bacterium]